MSRARRARRIAAAAAFGGGGLAGLGVAGWGVLTVEAKLARRLIGRPFGLTGPDASGIYLPADGDAAGTAHDEPIRMLMLGDSSAAGLGADSVEDTPGAVIASGLADLARRPVQLCVTAVVGAESQHLDVQIDRALDRGPAPEVAVIMVGANDVTHRVRPSESVRALDGAVRRLRDLGCEVVVGTCPDLGTVEPLAQPLRYVARRMSRELAAAQTIAVVEAGGRTVSLGSVLGPSFAQDRSLFSVDEFHPSAAGYASAAAVLLPALADSVGVWPARDERRLRGRGRVRPVARAAARAAGRPGTEVRATEVRGSVTGPLGTWARLLRRRPSDLPTPEEVTQAAEIPVG